MKIFVLGSVNVDIVAQADRLPKLGETVEGRRVDQFLGGKGANQAAQAAKLGAEVYFAGGIGNDASGQSAKSGLKEQGIDTGGIAVFDAYPTGCAIIQVDKNGDNTLIYAPGANRGMDVSVVENAKTAIASCDVFVTQSEINLGVMAAGLKAARAAGVFTILNPAPALTLSDAIYALCDVIAPNETECEALTGLSLRKDSLAACANWFMKKGVKRVIITLGALGAYYHSQEESFDTPAYKITPVDTTAAGDSFIGGYAYGVAAGLPARDAVKLGCACGAVTSTRMGAQSSIRGMDDVRKLYTI